MSAGPIRAALAVIVLGALVVWLVQPIGDACPDRGALPVGSARSSAPSFAPPLTRVCTYTTPDGLQARARYVPVVDWLVILAVAGVAAAAVALLGSSGPPREPGSQRSKRERSPAPPRRERPPPAPAAAPPPAAARGQKDSAKRDAAERERARQERAERPRRRRE